MAVPIYYATGSRLRAVGWASLSALMEPLGAVIGLAVACGGSLTDQVFGILFGLVAGGCAGVARESPVPAGPRVRLVLMARVHPCRVPPAARCPHLPAPTSQMQVATGFTNYAYTMHATL